MRSIKTKEIIVIKLVTIFEGINGETKRFHDSELYFFTENFKSSTHVCLKAIIEKSKTDFTKKNINRRVGLLKRKRLQ